MLTERDPCSCCARIRRREHLSPLPDYFFSAALAQAMQIRVAGSARRPKSKSSRMARSSFFRPIATWRQRRQALILHLDDQRQNDGSAFDCLLEEATKRLAHEGFNFFMAASHFPVYSSMALAAIFLASSR